jgi:hypothetical protein
VATPTIVPGNAAPPDTAGGERHGAVVGPHVGDPAELLRITAMLGRLNAELQDIDLDRNTLDRLDVLHRHVLDTLTGNLDAALLDELRRLVPGLDDEHRPEAGARLDHRLLVGWLEGLSDGIELVMVAAGPEHRQQRSQPEGGEALPGGMYL